MRIIQLFMLLAVLIVATGCTDERFSEINPQHSFVATMNILQPSLTFFDANGQLLEEWLFEKAYSGAVLVEQDWILLYGHQLDQAHIYELSSGKKLETMTTGIGVTNAYYDEGSKKIFMTNSTTNELTRYTVSGEKEQSVKLGNYPMSMVAVENKLYVINYKDTTLSVVAIDMMDVVETWPIAKSANGLVYIPSKDTLWIGGHGEGISPKGDVDVYAMQSGERVQGISMPLMPIAFARFEQEVAAVSHGTNMLYVTDDNGTHKWSVEIAANPFAVAYFHDQIVLAGYDDQTLYFVKDGEIVQAVPTHKGPFQLIVREGN